MEKRREPRVEVNAPVVVTALGENSHSPLGGIIRDFSGNGMLIDMPTEVGVGTCLRIETWSLLFLGQAVRCEAAGGEFHVAVKLRHSLRHLQELATLNQVLLDGDCEAAREAESPAEAVVPIMRE